MTGEPAPGSVREFLSRGGEVGRDLLNVDWESTPLGSMDQWPSSLSTVVRVLLTSRFAMWMAWGPELTFLCNDAYRRDTLGKKYPWALGRPAAEVWAEIWDDISPRIERVMSTGEATWDEALMLILERSGYREESYHTFSYSPLADDDGRITGMLCVVSEDSKRVIGERRMATLRDLGAVSSGVREEGEFLGAVGEVLGANPYSLPFTMVYLLEGEGSLRLACHSGIDVGHPAAPPAIAADATGGPWPVGELDHGGATLLDLTEERHPRLPMGAWDEPPVQALVVPIPAPAHIEPYGFLIVGLNPHTPLDSDYASFVELIAQHVSAGLAAARTYEAERHRAEQLEELDRAKTAFFSNVSHEFRTPLTLMLGPLQDALSGGDGLSDERLELVHRNALRLLKLVNTLLDFSRVEAGRMQAEFRPADLCRLTSELAGTFAEATARAGIELILDCCNPSEPVYVDRDMWERIVLNLVSNAFKATLEGQIKVELTPVEGGVELAVSDTGTGIPEDELDKLFQRFHRVRTVARSYEGTGIGLALVRELTDLHGGQVGVTSTLGEGSRFTVRIPTGSAHLPPEHVREETLEPAASIASLFVEEALSWVDATQAGRAAATESGEPVPADAPGSGRRPRVLVADDNPDLRRYLTTLLSGQFEVEAVGDGAAALESVRANPPDLLISDVMMPALDGYALLARLRGEPETRDLPVILLSARAGEEAAIEGLEAGADDYLPKPFSGRELLARVRANVELSHLRRQAATEVRAERSRLEQTLQQLPAGVLLAEAPSGRVILGNDQAAQILGHPVWVFDRVEDYGPFQLLHADRSPVEVEQRPMYRAVRGGEVVQDEDLLYRTGSGRLITVRINAAPIHGDDGEVVAGVLVFQDVSERVRTERLLASQRDVLALIANGEPLERALQEMARCVEVLSEYEARATILLVTEDGRRLVHAAAPSLPESYTQIIDGLEIGPTNGPCGAAAYRGESVVVADTMVDPLWAGLREEAALNELRASWSTPIRADDGEIVGTFSVYYREPREPAREDRRVVDLLARTAGVAIGRSRDAEARARRLDELQKSLLPRDLPEVPGIRAAVSFHPTDRGLDVGGDFYDLFELPDEAWGFVIGDVCGHGAEAAAVTAQTRHTTRAVARLQPRPARVLEIVNQELINSDNDRFCTALYGRLDSLGAEGSGAVRLTLACGGHPAPLVRRASGKIEMLRPRGPLLGVFEDAQFIELSCDLHPGDTLLLYTDGLIERNPRVQGDIGLRSLLASLSDSDAGDLLAELERRALGSPPARLPDDTAVLVLQVTGPPAQAAAVPSGQRAAA